MPGLDHIDPAIREWCHAREVVRRFGFTPEEIYFGFGVNDAGAPVLLLAIIAQGKRFNWTLSAAAIAVDELEAAYRTACDAINTMPKAEEAHEMEAFRRSKPFEAATGLLVELRLAGFRLREPSGASPAID